MMQSQNNSQPNSRQMSSSTCFFALALFVPAIVALTGCKGETVYKDSAETLDRLEKCRASSEEKQKLIASYEAELVKLKQNGSTSGEIVLTIEGNALTVKPGATGGGERPIDDKTAAAASQQFIDLVSKSRGAIQKCYEQALKKNTGLQAKTVTLRVSASFAATGAFQRSSFTPSLSDSFDGCMKSISTKWQLPAGPQSMTFQASVSLTPS
jgi:hypothetical protein